MKICQIGTGTLPVTPLVNGGVEKYVHYLCLSLQELGHDVTLIDIKCCNRPKTSYTVHEISLLFNSNKNLPLHLANELAFGYRASLLLGKLLKSEKYDVVNFQSQFTALFGIRIARQFGIPAIFTLHNPMWSDPASLHKYSTKITFWAERNSMKRADLVICLSHATAFNMVNSVGIAPSKVIVVPVGIHESWFAKLEAEDPAIKIKYAPNNEFIVLHVGRIVNYKNQLTIVDAIPNIVKQIPNVKFIFVGSADSPSYLELLTRKLAQTAVQKNVIFTGKISLSELRQLYYLADVFAFPSLQENMPQTMLEAMASSKAIIFSSIAPLREVLPDDAGIMISASDHEALMMATIKLLQNRRFRDELGLKARSYAYHNYRWSNIAQQIIKTYNHVSSGG